MNSIKIYSLIAFVFLIFSCKEKIELPLESQTPQLVIEGQVHDGVGPYYVQVSMSKAFNSNNTITPINPTLITISDNTGVSDTLTKMKDGFFQTQNLKGDIGKTYYLKVVYDSKTYTAESTLNSVPDIDSAYAWTFILKKDSKIASIKISDPITETNFYRYFIKINNKFPMRQYVFEDKLINGTKWSLSANQDDVKVGDTVEFSLLGIDKANFEYFKVLLQNNTQESNGNTAAAPVNPTSNIVGGALGYFSAHSLKTKTFVIK